jgi:hypothetical protein
MTSPETILKVAKKRGLDGIAVTDHNTIKGGVLTNKINSDNDFVVVIGTEIRTEYGDIIGLFIQNEIISKDFKNVVYDIKKQGGLVVLAHPCRKFLTYPNNVLDNIDLIEAFNARSHQIHNLNALNLAKINKKPMTAGSDSHIPIEIGSGRLLMDEFNKQRLLDMDNTLEGEESNYYFVHGSSVLIEKFKGYIK